MSPGRAARHACMQVWIYLKERARTSKGSALPDQEIYSDISYVPVSGGISRDLEQVHGLVEKRHAAVSHYVDCRERAAASRTTAASTAAAAVEVEKPATWVSRNTTPVAGAAGACALVEALEGFTIADSVSWRIDSGS